MSDFSLKYTNFIIEKQKKISQTQRLGLKKQIALSISLYCITFTTCYVILVIFDLWWPAPTKLRDLQKQKTNLIQQARPEITLLGWNHKCILLRIKNHVCDVHGENSDE